MAIVIKPTKTTTYHFEVFWNAVCPEKCSLVDWINSSNLDGSRLVVCGCCQVKSVSGCQIGWARLMATHAWTLLLAGCCIDPYRYPPQSQTPHPPSVPLSHSSGRTFSVKNRCWTSLSRQFGKLKFLGGLGEGGGGGWGVCPWGDMPSIPISW